MKPNSFWRQRSGDKIAHRYYLGAFYAMADCGAAAWPLQDVRKRTTARRCKNCERSK